MPKYNGPTPESTGSEATKHEFQKNNTRSSQERQALTAALALLKAGFSVVPTGPDKRPLLSWKECQTRPMAPAEARQHFKNGARLAVVCGEVSGNLECLDFDDPETFRPFLELLALRCPGLPERLLQRQTPSGGYHLIYRCAAPVAGNLKLASTEAGEVRIETRGEGGYFVSAPSPGYQVIAGRLTDCPTLTAEEVQAIHETARTFDRKKAAPLFTPTPGRTSTGDAPGDIFNESHTAGEILTAHGWKPDRPTSGGMGYTRPGKDSGTSGVLLETGNFYCWSSNAAPLEPGQSYSPFALYAAHQHGGDFSAAARELSHNQEKPPAPTPTQKVPRPLPFELLPVAPFDYALLPSSLRDWCRDIAERMQCPPDFVAVGLMTALGSVLGRRVGIRPQDKTDWTEVGNLWGLIVGRPGLLKTPALDAAMGPLNRLIAQAQSEYLRQLDEYEKTKETEQLRAAARKKQAAERLKENPGADLSDLQGAALEPPTIQRYKSNDPSPAALAELLRHAPNGLMVFRDEMVSLFNSLEREDNAEGRGFYLTAWGGNSPFTSDRIGRGFNLHIPAVCLSLLGGTQPGKLGAYVRQAVGGGAGDDGLLQRFGLLVWPDTNQSWQNIDRPTNRTAKNAAYEVFDRLDKLDPAEVGAEQDRDFDGSPDGIPYLRFSAEALELFVEWRTDLENHKLRGNDHPAIISHLAKYRKLVPSLALLIHLADGGKGPVAVHPTMQALAWSEYLETHARRVYGAVSQPEVTAAKAILRRIEKGDLPATFKARDVYKAGWAGLTDRQAVADALALLVDHDWLTEEQEQTGGRPTTVYQAKEVPA